MFYLSSTLCLIVLIIPIVQPKTISFISNSKEARDNRGVIISKFTFHGTQAKALLRGNDSIGGLYFFPREKLIHERPVGDCNEFLRKASFSLFPTKSESEFKERLFPLWTQEPQTFYALFVDAATCYPQYPYQSNVGLELHLMNDEGAGGHLSAEENGLKSIYMLLVIVFAVIGVWLGLSLYNIINKGGPLIMVMQLFIGVCGCEAASLLLPTLHWMSYESNGWGSPFLYSLSTLTTLAADLLMTALTVDVVLGWTLGSSKRLTTARSEKMLRCTAALCIVYFLLYVYVQYIDANDPAYYSFSSYREMFYGLIWVVQGVLYLLVLNDTHGEDKSVLRQSFYTSFAWICITWYFGYPLSQLIVLCMAEHHRVKILLSVWHFLRAFSLAQLARLFIQRSLFWEVSSLSASTLPFAARNFAARGPETEKSVGGGYRFETVSKRFN